MACYLSDADTVDGVSDAIAAILRVCRRALALYRRRRAERIQREYGGMYLADWRRMCRSPVIRTPLDIKERI